VLDYQPRKPNRFDRVGKNYLVDGKQGLNCVCIMRKKVRTGRRQGTFCLTAVRLRLRSYLRRGGLLFVWSACRTGKPGPVRSFNDPPDRSVFFLFSHGPHRVCHDALNPRCSRRWPYEVRHLRRLALKLAELFFSHAEFASAHRLRGAALAPLRPRCRAGMSNWPTYAFFHY
jgi:hypothetical protein